MPNILPIDIEMLKKGCLIASAAHAISMAKFPDFAHEQSWDSYNFNVQSNESRGTITFVNENIVGVFRKDNSIRIKLYQEKSALDLFENADDVIKNIARKDSLEYLYFNINGTSIPVATTVFWCSEGQIVSNDTYENFLAQGGDIIKNMFLSETEAINVWCDHYEFTPNERALLHTILEQKERVIANEIMLTYEDYNEINFVSQSGREEFKTSLKEINVLLPS